MTSQVIASEVQNEEKAIDREKVCLVMAVMEVIEWLSLSHRQKCPLLLRVFLSLNGRHNNCNDYSRSECPANELQVYTWTDATLKEITGLVREVNVESRRKGTYFDFALVYPDPRSAVYRMRDIGSTCSGVKGVDDNKTLSECRFQIGDHLDISIQLPNERRVQNRRNERNDRRDRY